MTRAEPCGVLHMSLRFTHEPLDSFGRELLRVELPSYLPLKAPLIYRALKLLKDEHCIPPGGEAMAEVALEEAIVNAIVHGNRMDTRRKVHVEVFADTERWGVIVQDEGHGFSRENLPDREAPDFYTRENGRGIMLMESYMDDLAYNERGNRLRMVRHRQPDPDPGYQDPVDQALQKSASLTEEPRVDQDAPHEKVVFPSEIELDLGSVAAAPRLAEAAVTTAMIDGIRIVRIHSPRLVQDTISDVQMQLAPAVDGATGVVVDMSRVTFMASVGISTIMAAHKRAVASRARMILAGCSPILLDVFKATGLGKLLQFEPDVPSAIRRLKS